MKVKKLLLCIAVPLAVGALAALLTRDSMIAFSYVRKPPLTPPAWVFPAAWTVLYALMGVASYLVSRADRPKRLRDRALMLYGVQLFFNFGWPLIFFVLRSYLFALVWLLVLWVLVLAATLRFFDMGRTAGVLLLPYLAWCTFAAYLNYGIYLLN